MNEHNRRLLPPMATLHSFTAAARCGSFSRAADELALTQGAVSRQVAALEEWLGQTLFDRRGRRVALNEHGRRYADAVSPALAAIRRATRAAIERPDQRVVELATLPSFGMRWLAPRLPRLAARFPDLIVNFSARSHEFDFADEPFDAAIHVGSPDDWPRVDHHWLFDETVVAVVAPALAEGINQPGDLARLPLLVQANRRDAWKRWAAFHRIAGFDREPTASFAHFQMLAQAAVAGGGAALIPAFLIENELDAATLVAPFADPLTENRAYYLVTPPDPLEKSGVRDLRAWLLGECRLQRDAGPAAAAPGDQPPASPSQSWMPT